MKATDSKAGESTTYGMGKGVPPLEEFVLIFFQQNGLSVSAGEEFFQYYSELNWHNECGNPIKNWKTLAQKWIWNARRFDRFTLIEYKEGDPA